MLGLSGLVADYMSQPAQPAGSGLVAVLLMVGMLVLARYWQAMSQNRVEHSLARTIQRASVDALLSRKLDAPEGRFSEGELVQRLTRDAERAVQAASQIPRTVISLPLTVILLAGFLVSRGGTDLALLALIFVPISLGISFMLGRGMVRAALDRSRSEASLAEVLSETGRGAELLRAVEGGEAYLEMLAARSRDLELRSARFAHHGVLASGVSEGLKITVFLAAVWAVGRHPESAQLQAGLLPAAWFLISSITSLAASGAGAAAGLSSFNRLPLDEDTAGREPVWTAGSKPPSVTITGLAYGYSGGRRIIAGLSLDLPPGGWLAITGPSGSGKTTLIRALLGFLTIPDGAVRLNRINLNHIPVRERRQLFSLLTQEPVVLGLTVRENFLIANPDASEALIRDTIQRIGLESRINETGLDLPLEPATLSGGEKERLALARLLVSTAPVAVLDEPGVFLDSANEQKIIALLEGLRGRKTVITVTHNARILRRADLILELRPDGSWSLNRNESGSATVTPLRPA